MQCCRMWKFKLFLSYGKSSNKEPSWIFDQVLDFLLKNKMDGEQLSSTFNLEEVIDF